MPGIAGWAGRTAGDDALRAVREVDGAHDVLVRELVELQTGERVPHARAEVGGPRHGAHARVVQLARPHRALRT